MDTSNNTDLLGSTSADFMEFAGLYRWLINNLSESMSRESQKYGLSFDQFLVMHEIQNANNETTNSALADKMQVSRSAISRQCRSLRKMAFIAEQSDENDQRIRRVHLTEKGLEVYRHLLFYYVDLYKDLQNEIGQDTVGATIDQSKKNLWSHGINEHGSPRSKINVKKKAATICCGLFFVRLATVAHNDARHFLC